MKGYYSIFFILFLCIHAGLNAQYQKYTVEIAPFSSRIYQVFSPVFYKDGIVFCSNQSDNSLVKYKNEDNPLFKIFYVPRRDSMRFESPRLLATELVSGFNDGPATFNAQETKIFFSRNNSIEKSLRNISDTLNKLGIYSAELVNGGWTNIQAFKHNNPDFNLTAPALSHDERRLFFSSDMPGGFGGMDLFYSDMIDGKWNEPVNMGPIINTSGNESFPFMSESGLLFYASDGHPGLGKLDLFYTSESNNEWLTPVNLGTEINSMADDFGMTTDSKFEKGYFSSNRRGTDDIFSFNRYFIDFGECERKIENVLCYTFYVMNIMRSDTLKIKYEWDFGDGNLLYDEEVDYCFPGPGDYSVSLILFDEISGDTISLKSEYSKKLTNAKQAYIQSESAGLVNQKLSFEAVTSDLGEVTISKYYWDFGEGFSEGHSVMKKEFKNPGTYMVSLGLVFNKKEWEGVQKVCVMREIIIE